MPKDATSFGTAGNRSGNLLITSPTRSPPGGRVLNDLQSVDEFGGESGEEGIAVIDAGCDK